MTGWRVIERRRDGALYVNDVIVTKLIELFGRYAMLHVRRDEVEHFRREAASDAHFFDVQRRF